MLCVPLRCTELLSTPAPRSPHPPALHRSKDIIDVDSPVEGERHYQVRVEPEEAAPWSLVPCLVSLFSFSYAGDRRAIQ